MSKKVLLILLVAIVLIVPILESKLSHKNDKTNFLPVLGSNSISALGSFSEDDSSTDIDEDYEIATD